MLKKRIVSFCATMCAAALLSPIASAQELPGVLWSSSVSDLNTRHDFTESVDYTERAGGGGYSRIAVGEGGELNIASGVNVTLGLTNPESGVYTFNGGVTNMAEGSTLTASQITVGQGDPGGTNANGRRDDYRLTEGTFNANGATINANVAVEGKGVLTLTNSTVNVPDIEEGYEGSLMNLDGGTINATSSTINLGAFGWSNSREATANINGGQINGYIINEESSTFKANGTTITGNLTNANASTLTMNDVTTSGGYVFSHTGSTLTANNSTMNGTVYNQAGSTMTLENSTVNGVLNSFSGENVLKVDGVSVSGYYANGGGRALISNELHVGADGLDMSGGRVIFYNNDRYNAGSSQLTTIVLTLTEELFNGLCYDDDYIAFYLSDFITNSDFYWYGADGVQYNTVDGAWLDNFDFEFDITGLSEETLAKWGGDIFDLEDADRGRSLIGYNFDTGIWETGHAYDVVWSFVRGDGGPPSDTPEPATLAIIGFSALGAGLYRRSRSKHTNV